MREWLPKVACRSNLCVTFSPMHYSLGLTGHLYWALDCRSFSLHLDAVIVLMSLKRFKSNLDMHMGLILR